MSSSQNNQSLKESTSANRATDAEANQNNDQQIIQSKDQNNNQGAKLEAEDHSNNGFAMVSFPEDANVAAAAESPPSSNALQLNEEKQNEKGEEVKVSEWL